MAMIKEKLIREINDYCAENGIKEEDVYADEEIYNKVAKEINDRNKGGKNVRKE